MTSAGHIPLIDHLRGLAAVMVTWFHLTNGYGPNWVMQTGRYGWLGVEIFFVISGFVITLALARGGPNRGGFGTFMVKRIIRLEPPYLVSILLVLVLGQLSAMMPGLRGQPTVVQLPQLLFHLAYLVPFTRYDWVQPVYWTLSYEFFFYLFAGLFLPLLAMRLGSALFAVTAAIAALLVVGSCAPPLILLFVFGIATCRLHLSADRPWLTVAVVLASAAAMIVVGMALQAGVGLATALLIAAHRRLPAFPPAIARSLGGLGSISYSLYLIHVPLGGRIVNLGGRFVHTPLQQFALSVVALLCCCVTATLFWWAIERPAQRAAQRFGRTRHIARTGE